MSLGGATGPEPLKEIARRARRVIPTMDGFVWQHPGGGSQRGMPGDAWCVRDCVCKLFGWPVGGPDWAAFVEGPHPDDMPRLEEHLGLVHVDRRLPADVEWFAANNSHPGLVILSLHAVRMGHVLLAHDLRDPPAIAPQYLPFRATVDGYLVDVRQPPLIDR